MKNTSKYHFFSTGASTQYFKINIKRDYFQIALECHYDAPTLGYILLSISVIHWISFLPQHKCNAYKTYSRLNVKNKSENRNRKHQSKTREINKQLNCFDIFQWNYLTFSLWMKCDCLFVCLNFFHDIRVT